MRIFPLALIAIGVFGVLKHYGFIDPAFVQLFWPLLLIGIGVAMLARGPRWRADRAANEMPSISCATNTSRCSGGNVCSAACMEPSSTERA